MIKREIFTHLEVAINGIELSSISKIDFIFKQGRNHTLPALKKSTYNSDGTGDVSLDNDIFLIPWSTEETGKFRPDANFYMDTKIYRNDSEDNPVTPIVELFMNETLFESESE